MDSLISEGGLVPAEAAAAAIARKQIDVQTLMLRLLPAATGYAQSPVSQFSVGAVVQGTSTTGPGNLYLGANLEIIGEGLQATVHAEQAAVNNAWLHGETGLRSIAASTTPCGHCRQFLQELDGAENLCVLTATNGSAANSSYTKHLLGDLFPSPFGPQNLKVPNRLMDGTTRSLHVDTDEPPVLAAAAAATASHAPYTGTLAGVALVSSSGRTICGRVSESAALNPSLTPMMSALSQCALQSVNFAEIVDAVLVEVPTLSTTRPAAESQLQLVAPDVTLRYVAAARLPR